MTQPNSRPSLDKSYSTAADGERILSSLNSLRRRDGTADSQPKKSSVKAVAIALLICGLAFGSYQYVVSQKTGSKTPSNLPLVTANTAAPSKEPIQIIEEKAVPTVPPSPAAPTAPAEAAQIIDETPVARSQTNSNAGKATKLLEADANPPVAAPRKTVRAKPTVAQDNSVATAPKLASPRAAKTATPATAAAATTAAQKKTITDTDKDINLIAALLEHNNAALVKPAAAGETKKPVALAASAAPATTNRAAAPAAPASQSTESQLKQCAELGFIEREVCRLKTCTDLWETNAACKAALSPAK